LKEALETVGIEKNDLIEKQFRNSEELRKSSPDESPYVSSMSASESKNITKPELKLEPKPEPKQIQATGLSS